MYVRRYASVSNATDWWFYLDVDADGVMEDGEKVLQVDWQGNNGGTTRVLFDYVEDDPAGDPLTSGGTADGYDMPGTITSGVTLSPAVDGGATSGPFDGLAMETSVRWDELDATATGPFSVGFHISASKGTNIPQQIDDNMNGPSGGGGGGLFQFSEPGLAKSGPINGVGAQAIEFTITLTNDGPDAALGIEVTDDCGALEIVARDPPLGNALLSGESFAYLDHSATNGDSSYDPLTGLWTVATLADQASETLTLECLVFNDEPMTVRNSAEITGLDTIDTDLGNNLATSQTVVVEPAVALSLSKSSAVDWDPANEGLRPKRIPGACITYTIEATNAGQGRATDIEIVDSLPTGLVLYTGDFEDGGSACGGTGGGVSADSPVDWVADDSGLGFSFVDRSDVGDSVEFRDAGGNPIEPDGGYDPDVRTIVVRPTGTMLGRCCGADTADGEHSFRLRFRARLE